MDDRPVRSGRLLAGNTSAVAAAEAQAARAAVEQSKATGVPLPGGVIVPLEAFNGIESLPTEDHTRYLAEPEKYLLLNPKPGFRYVWAAYDDTYGGNTTAARIRSQQYRPVKQAEVRTDHGFDLHFKTHKGTTDYVHWRDLILCELAPSVAERQYDAPVGRYLRALGAVQEGFQSDVETTSKGLAVAETKQELSPA